MFYNKEYKKLKLKIEVFEKLTDVSFDKWFTDIGSIEHKYHSKLEDLNKREATIAAREKLFEKEVEAIKAIVIGGCEQAYHHDMHDYIKKITEKNLEIMKGFAEAMKQTQIINNNK